MSGSVAANDLVTLSSAGSLVGQAARGQLVPNAFAVATANKQRQETATVTAVVLFGLGVGAAVSQEAQLPHSCLTEAVLSLKKEDAKLKVQILATTIFVAALAWVFTS